MQLSFLGRISVDHKGFVCRSKGLEVIRGSPRLAGQPAQVLVPTSLWTLVSVPLVSPASDAKTLATHLPVGAPPVPHVDIRTHLEQGQGSSEVSSLLDGHKSG